MSFQVNAAAVAYAFDWGDHMQGYLDTQNSVTSIGTSYFELACFGGGDASAKNGFVAETLLYILLPLIFVGLTGAGALLYVYFRNDRVLDKEGLRNAKTSAMGIASITLFLLQPTLVKQFALLFSCTKMGAGDDDFFLMENLHIRCYTGEHFVIIFGLGLPLLGLYVLGIPLAMYMLLSHPVSQRMIGEVTKADQAGRGAQLDDQASIRAASAARSRLDAPTQAFQTSYAFLFLGYKPELYLWEIAVLARKGSLSLIGVAFSTDPRTQVMLGMLIIFVSAVAHARFMPFDDDLMNNFEFISLAASAMTFFIGVFTMDGVDQPDDSATKDIASFMAFSINMLYIIAAVPIGLKVRRLATETKRVHKVIKLLMLPTLPFSSDTSSILIYSECYLIYLDVFILCILLAIVFMVCYTGNTCMYSRRSRIVTGQ